MSNWVKFKQGDSVESLVCGNLQMVSNRTVIGWYTNGLQKNPLSAGSLKAKFRL